MRFCSPRCSETERMRMYAKYARVRAVAEAFNHGEGDLFVAGLFARFCAPASCGSVSSYSRLQQQPWRTRPAVVTPNYGSSIRAWSLTFQKAKFLMYRPWAPARELHQSMGLDISEGQFSHVHAMEFRKEISYVMILRLAFQSLGVVYGDLSTSPLYVFSNVFPSDLPDYEKVMGALSLIIYSLILIPLVKYVFLVMRANRNGEGGTFGLYSLLCRHVNVSTIPNAHRTDEELTSYNRELIKETSLSARTAKWLESKKYRKNALLGLVLVGTCMVIGDGIFTPAISVLSSVGGIKVQHPDVSNVVVVVIACIILVALFSLQHFGTDKVGWMFAPAVFLWLFSIGTIGAYNIFKHDTRVLKAFLPIYIIKYFKQDKKRSWVSLGGIMLSITGTEALFADLSHFSVSSVQIAFTTIVFPCLLLQYMGQAAYILNNKHHVDEAFYRSIPDSVYWPVFLVATFAAVIASQATITATFSIIKQSVALGCFPRVKVLHTSNDISGQIYIPEINWILMILCIIVTAGFSSTTQIGNAYGLAVILVMLVTTILMAIVKLVVWRVHWFFVVIFTSFFLSIELGYFSSLLFKVDQGGWAPLVIATLFLVVMYVWHYGTVKRYEFEMQSTVSIGWIVGLGPGLGLVRVPGVGLLYTELVEGVPHIFSHLITHLPAIHSLVVFVCVKYLPVSTVAQEERFLMRRIGPKEFSMFRCVVRYGYAHIHKKDDNFEKMLFDALVAFVRYETVNQDQSDSAEYTRMEDLQKDPVSTSDNMNSMSLEMISAGSFEDTIVSERSEQPNQQVGFLASECKTVDDELRFLRSCWDAGVVHILGNTMIRARRESSLIKKIAVDFIYAFLRRICRGNSVIFNVPHENLLNVGQVCYV